MATKAILFIDDTREISEFVSGSKQRTISQFINYLSGLAGGARRNQVTLSVLRNLVAASGTVTISSGSGTITATINGVAIEVTWGTSDTATATALAAAINASENALVADHVTASAASGVVTITASSPGQFGNVITLAASGTGATASGARLTGGTSTSADFAF